MSGRQQTGHNQALKRRRIKQLHKKRLKQARKAQQAKKRT